MEEVAEHNTLYHTCSDKELKEAVLFYINQQCYRPDEYTHIIKSILEQDSFSPKQRKILERHLYYHKEID